MEVILDFLVNNYIWFLVITLIMLFALIGYLVDIKKDERFSKKIEIDSEIESRLNVANAANITLNQMVKQQSDLKDNNSAGNVSGNKILEGESITSTQSAIINNSIENVASHIESGNYDISQNSNTGDDIPTSPNSNIN
ncbi:MAG: hypothetical protein IJA94_02745 [Bacilli bacterium]|nr:hypothetical protein [Bacilli bacterium]